MSTTLPRRTLLAAAAATLAAPALPRLALAQRVPARVGVIPIVGAAPVFVADREGWAREAGLDFAYTTFESGPNMIQALASGTIDIYAAGVAPLGVARSRGVDVKVVASTATGENVFVATPRLAAFFKPGTSHAEALRAYRAQTGKPARLATQPPGSVPNTTLQYWLWEQIKADKADVEIVAMGIDATQQAILADAVEGATIREPALTIVQKRNPGIRLIALGDELFPGQPGTVVAVSGAFLARNEDRVQGLVNGLVRAGALLTRDPDKAAPHVAANLAKGIVDLETIKAALKSPASKFTIDPRAIIQPTKAMQDYQVKLGSLRESVSLDGLFDTRFFEKAPSAT
ncbi:ABC transporter substrate-binding protein [Phreatobacter oligotrophus]|jgi:NitT/TauT family transport system substrate-binding protein|uniref:NitT/TauT family transport system substrate-binding protein n=1 Tax=Phreatobacter oligotrophus TaxID=1122261 RepID=A0A2T4ZIM7_9HYPH|nr:ABC transporter substrate-binding protein [Phreatobacter oligotrophus]PTM61821.1 NitT/TauT family transport system substrate-binding protein [Phreatobacter oligotrophus]